MTLQKVKLDSVHQQAFNQWLKEKENKYNKFQAGVCYAVAATYLDPDLVYPDTEHWIVCLNNQANEAEKAKGFADIKNKEDALKFIEKYHNDKIQKEKEWVDGAYDDYSRTVRSDGYQMTLSQETALKEMELIQIKNYLDKKIKKNRKVR